MEAEPENVPDPASPAGAATEPGDTAAQSVEVIDPQGRHVSGPRPSEGPDETVEQPSKVLRIGAMTKQLLDELRATTLDAEGRERMASIHRTSVEELSTVLSADLRRELDRLAPPFDAEKPPTEAELRVAQAQLVGWLEGLFHGIQATLFAQQAQAKAQIDQMRRLPPGQAPPPGAPSPGPGAERPGTYL